MVYISLQLTPFIMGFNQINFSQLIKDKASTFIIFLLIIIFMSFELDSKTIKWLYQLRVIGQGDLKQQSNSLFEVKEPIANQFENGVKISQIVIEIYKRKGLPIPSTMNHLKLSNNTAAQLYNWNILNEALKKMNFQIDSETKNLIINGDRAHLGLVVRKLQKLYESSECQDSLDSDQFDKNTKNEEFQIKQSLTLSRSEDVQKPPALKSTGSVFNEEIKRTKEKNEEKNSDLLEFIISQITKNLKLNRRQTLALLSDNNKYLAHVFVKGVKGQFVDIQQLMQSFYTEVDYIVEKMMEQNDMCFYFLQVIKPCLLSKSEEIAQWGCRILTKIGNQLANKEMLPLAYDWFVQETGGLSTTILALSRHPKLNQSVVGYILQFARYNVAELFTVQLKKVTNNDHLSYVKFMLLIFNPLVQSKISAEELLNSGAIDYWVEMTLKDAQNEPKNSKELRMYCIQFLIKIWRAYPAHIEDTLDQVNNIMTSLKRGIREESQVMRFTLVEMTFDLLDQFASKKNPYASIVYKKITFLFIENHEELTMRQFILRNIQHIFQKYSSIPVDIFLQPFIKQIKISENKSYIVNIFDMEFINVAVKHRKLKVGIGLELFDLLAKTKLNSYSFSTFASDAMDVLIDRFIEEEIFLEYTVKLVKISLAMLYSTLKQKKKYDDNQRLNAQKRAEIINFIISLIQRENSELNEEIKMLVIHVKVQISYKLGIQHKGIERILSYFHNIDAQLEQARQNMKDDTSSNATSTKNKNNFHLPKIQSRNMMLRDETSSQQSFQSNGTKYSSMSKQEFPIKDYAQFATEQENKFLKENGIGLKKKGMTKRKGYSTEKDFIDPKVQQQIYKVKIRKEEEEKKKKKQKEYLERKKQLLKVKIQKELEQRNVKQGLKGNEKDVEVKVIFGENQINQHILQQDEQAYCKDLNIEKEEQRDSQSIKIILKRYFPFIKKIFTRYSNLKGGKKDLQDEDVINQVDLVRMCKEKNIEKNKNAIVEIMRATNNKNTKSVTIDGFLKFLEGLCISIYVKEKCKTNLLMGDLMRKVLRRMAQGENFKLDEDDDQMCNSLSEKVRYNPHVELPENYKKIYERVFKVHQKLSYPIKKTIKNEFADCYEIVNEILKDALKINVIEEEVNFLEQGRVIHKKQYHIPPKPLKRDERQGISLLEEREGPSSPKMKKTNRTLKKTKTVEKQNNRSQSRQKVNNAAEQRRSQMQEEEKNKRQKEQKARKLRSLQVKKKLQLQQEEREKEKQRKKAEKREQQLKQEERQRKQKQRKERYTRQQRQKLEKYKKDQQEKQKEEKQKKQVQKQKDDQERKAKMKQYMKKEDEKRKEQYEKIKKQRQLSEENKKKKREEQQKRKENLKKQMMKKIEDEKEKYETQKLSKEVLRKIYTEPEIQELVNLKYKQELKGLFNYGRQFNEFKLDKGNTNTIQQKGWLNLCQQFSFCDSGTANKIFKLHIKQKNVSGFNFEDFQQALFELSTKKEMANDLEDYQNAKKYCCEKFDKYLSNLKLPRQNQKLKAYFQSLKNQISKKKEQIVVSGPDGKNETWQLNQ